MRELLERSFVVLGPMDEGIGGKVGAVHGEAHSFSAEGF